MLSVSTDNPIVTATVCHERRTANNHARPKRRGRFNKYCSWEIVGFVRNDDDNDKPGVRLASFGRGKRNKKNQEPSPLTPFRQQQPKGTPHVPLPLPFVDDWRTFDPDQPLGCKRTHDDAQFADETAPLSKKHRSHVEEPCASGPLLPSFRELCLGLELHVLVDTLLSSWVLVSTLPDAVGLTTWTPPSSHVPRWHLWSLDGKKLV